MREEDGPSCPACVRVRAALYVAFASVLALLPVLSSCDSSGGSEERFCGTIVASREQIAGVAPWFVDGTANESSQSVLPLVPEAGTWVRVVADCSDSATLKLIGSSVRIGMSVTADDKPGGRVVAVRIEPVRLGTSVLSITERGRSEKVKFSVARQPVVSAVATTSP